jgi:uncharacterized membrane protein YphA (DoxX/SURF4 family)
MQERSKKALWAGWALSVLPCLMLLFSASLKLTQNEQAVKGFADFGYPASTLIPIGMAELLCTIIYLIPRTAVFGAILLAGFLGGAVATHVHGSQNFLPPIAIAAMLWLGLYLREPRLQALVPVRK